MKITMNINDELLERVDRYAKSHYITRTSVFSMGAHQLVLQDEVVLVLGQLKNCIASFLSTGELTQEQQEQLDKLDEFLELFDAADDDK